jgi:hypothetical protein
MYSVKYQAELNRDAVDAWFRKYSELFSCFTVEGPTGLKARLAAFMNTENYGTDELNKLAETSLTEKQWFARQEIDPSAPYDDGIYMALFQRLASQAFLHLVERGVIEEIKLVEEFPDLASQQFDSLVNEARAVPQHQVSAAEAKAAEAATLKDFADKYRREPSANLKPRGGVVILAGEMVPYKEYQSLLSAALASGALK